MAQAAAAAVRTVYVVDDDEAVRDSLRMMFRTAGLGVEIFRSATEFLQKARPRPPCCLVLDIRMPILSGIGLQEELRERGLPIPIIFITGHGDIPMAVEAVKKGAYDFIEKPFDDLHLLCQVLNAIEETGKPSEARTPNAAHALRLAQLTDRERQVLERVLEGKPSREIATELFISVKTVEFHRARIMQKLGVSSVAELFRACLLGLQPR
jgi:FixJ family two-component response regulator